MVALIEGRAAYPPEGVIPSFDFFHSHQRVKEKRSTIDSFNRFLSDYKNIVYYLDMGVSAFGVLAGFRSIASSSLPLKVSLPAKSFFGLSPVNSNLALVIGGGALFWGAFILYLSNLGQK